MLGWQKAILLGVVLLFGMISTGLWLSGRRHQAIADTIRATTAGFSEKEPFMANGNLVSPSGKTLLSPYQKTPCLFYRSKVSMVYETTDEDGDETTVRRSVFEEAHKVPDLAAKFDGHSALLAPDRVERFFQPFSVELDEVPEYVGSYSPPNTTHWFEVTEDLYLPEQAVFVVARLTPQGALEPHPAVGELIVYPGTQEQCVQAISQDGRTNKTVAAVLLGIALLVCLGLGLAFRSMSPA
jgi:hypothetical protein